MYVVEEALPQPQSSFSLSSTLRLVLVLLQVLVREKGECGAHENEGICTDAETSRSSGAARACVGDLLGGRLWRWVSLLPELVST